MPGRQDSDAAAAFLSGGRGFDDSGPGPWFPAGYDGECGTCGAFFFAGDIIRADGDGGWEGQECCGDD
jgi:hypothetical protein